MTASNRLPSFLATMVWEGGAHLSLIRSDPGNWTGNRVGVGQLKGTKWGVAAGSHPTLDIASLTPDQASLIFETGYWRPIGGDALATGFDHCVSDDSYNAGPGAAAKRLRKIAALRLNDPAAMIHAYSKARLAFLHALKTWSVFGTGWARRVAGVEAESIRMAYQAQTQAPPAGQPKVERPSSAAYPTPADIAPRKSAPISPASVAAEAAKAQGARAAAQKGAGGAATASGAGSALAPAAGHVHWAVWAVCGGAALAAIAVCLWRWRAHGARFRALSNLATELKGASHVKS